MLQHAAKLGKQFGYSAMNLNCGCPSSRVADTGGFGASLMLEPRRTADICAGMLEEQIPVSVKCRTGVVPSRGAVSDPGVLHRFLEEVTWGVRLVAHQSYSSH